MACSELTPIEFIRLESGDLMMGSTLEEVDRCVHEWGECLLDPSYRSMFRQWILKEYPAHRVRVKGLFLSRYPVTNAEYREFLSLGSVPTPESIARGLPGDHPVWGVELIHVNAYIDWRGREEQGSYRLPTEAEWEWAARGPQGLQYPWGDEFHPELCNTVESGRGTTTAVRHHPKSASWLGVEDLAGNVEEWTSGFYSPYPEGVIIEDDLFKLLGPAYSILRGGSFALGGDLARGARRHGPHPGGQFRVRGFRLAADLTVEKIS